MLSTTSFSIFESTLLPPKPSYFHFWAISSLMISTTAKTISQTGNFTSNLISEQATLKMTANLMIMLPDRTMSRPFHLTPARPSPVWCWWLGPLLPCSSTPATRNRSRPRVSLQICWHWSLWHSASCFLWSLSLSSNSTSSISPRRGGRAILTSVLSSSTDYLRNRYKAHSIRDLQLDLSTGFLRIPSWSSRMGSPWGAATVWLEVLSSSSLASMPTTQTWNLQNHHPHSVLTEHWDVHCTATANWYQPDNCCLGWGQPPCPQNQEKA